jgi:hypothetical protein
MYFTQAYGFYFNITWLPTYLAKARGFTATELAVMAGLPLILSAILGPYAGCSSTPASRSRTHSPTKRVWHDTPQGQTNAAAEHGPLIIPTLETYFLFTV